MQGSNNEEKERGHNEDEGTNNSNAGDLVWLSIGGAFN